MMLVKDAVSEFMRKCRIAEGLEVEEVPGELRFRYYARGRVKCWVVTRTVRDMEALMQLMGNLAADHTVDFNWHEAACLAEFFRRVRDRLEHIQNVPKFNLGGEV